MVFVDAHCHLGSRQFDSYREEMIRRMLDKGVSKPIMICCSRHDLEKSLILREEHSSFKLAVSVHPQDLEYDYSEARLQEIERIINEFHPDMIGETGLDYYSHPHTRDQQRHFFISQLELARKYGLPVNIHSRRASADTLDILKSHRCKGIMHSYSGSIEMARLYIKEGYYISLGASVLFPNARRPREVAAQIPLDRLLIETDAPYQSPVLNHRHEPADVANIYEEISRIRGISLEELCAAVEHNFDNVFAK